MRIERPFVGRKRELTTILNRLRIGVSTVIIGEGGVGKSAVSAEVCARLQAQGQRTLFLACSDWGGATSGVTAALVEGAAAIIVDDAHLLDVPSAHQLSTLIGAARTGLVATVRPDDRPLHSLASLWSVGPCERLELRPLPGDDLRRMLEQQLGGDLDDRLVQVLIDRTRGNPLFARELVQGAVQSGALVSHRGVWRLVGELPLTSAAVDMIQAQLAGLDEEERQALQMLALAQPLPLLVAERITSVDVLEALETKGLIAVDSTSGMPALSCRHPLYGEVLRSDLGVLRSRRLRSRLLQAMGPASSLPARERLLAISWSVDLGESVDLEELLACSRIAATRDAALAERLLRAVLDHPAPDLAASRVEAATMLAQLLVIQGRVAEADHAINEIIQHPGPVSMVRISDEQRAQLAAVRVVVRTRLGEISDALRLAGATAGAAPPEFEALQIQALYAQLMLLTARLDEALRIAEPIIAHSTDNRAARSVAAYTVVAAHSFAGRIDATEQALRAALPILDDGREEIPYGLAVAQVSTAIAQTLVGRFSAAAQLGQHMHDNADLADDPWLRPRSATVLGLLALARGQPETATVHLRSAIASLTPLDAMFIRYNLAFLARAAALAGNLTEAQQALNSPVDAPTFPLYEADWQLAEAAVLAAQCRLEDAAGHAMTAARTAASHGQWAIAAIAAHDAARYADTPEAADLLTTAADLVDGPLPALMRDHAVARLARDPLLLNTVSLQFEHLGATLFAAEAAYAGADNLHRSVDRASATETAARATALHSRCERLFVPWAIGRTVKDLTSRERQVALLAAAGHPDQHIGVQLGISIRTVQTHLTHVYMKLNVQRRGELPGALTGSTPPPHAL